MVKRIRSGGRTDLLIKVALAIVSPLLIIAPLEGLAYVWERSQSNGSYAWELVASRRLDLDTYLEPGAGFTLMKPHSHYEWQGIPVVINSHGLRGPEVSYEKPPGTFRILNLGDSVAMGWGVREESTYGRQLEKLLNERNAGEQRYEVINAGVPGWNLENAIAYLQAEGLRYEPDLILLDLTVANDVKGKSALVGRKRAAPIEWLRANTYFWPFLTVQLRLLEARAAGQQRIDLINPPTAPEKYFPLEPDAEQWTSLWNWVLAIDKIAREERAAFALILFPLEFQVLDEQYPTLPQELLASRAAEAGIPVLDLLPRFREACQERPGGSCQLEDRYLFADVWMHPSAYGHEVAANELDSLLSAMLEHNMARMEALD